ncbi:MAG TPA: hypothetical protein VFC26_14810 [Verrucomicrobiae bacterium]|nr:hypothetical protein [Verrucomicrobiae bacterium]
MLVKAMHTRNYLGRLAILLVIFHGLFGSGAAEPSSTNTIRIAAAQAAGRVVDFRLKPEEAHVFSGLQRSRRERWRNL